MSRVLAEHPAIPDRISSELAGAAETSVTLRETLSELNWLALDFGRESHGLVPLAQAEAMLVGARTLCDSVNDSLARVAADPTARDVVEARQERRVDIALERRGAPPAVEMQTVLLNAAEYLLRVGIGLSFPRSIVTGEVPEIDLLLPDLEPDLGYQLEVAVYGQDFRTVTAPIQSVYLPRFGASMPVEFVVQAPLQPVDRATLRIAVYYQGHVVQTFLLTTRVGSQETYAEDGLSVRLEFSRTRRLENLADLHPRTVSLGLNEDGANHRLLIKGDETVGDYVLSERLLSRAANAFRRALYQATYSEKNSPRFPEDGQETTREEEAAAVVRTLAELGNKLHLELFRRTTPSLKQSLRQLTRSRDETIQIVRHDPNYAFPWAALYDFDPPEESNAPVCFGKVSGRPCLHEGTEEVVCVYGFWGVRHRIEQLLVPPDPSSGIPTLSVPAPQACPPVLLALGASDRWVDDLARKMNSFDKAFATQLQPDVELLDTLWGERSRPAIAILLGHLEGAGDAPRIGLSGGRYVEGDPVTRREFTQGEWLDPRSIVFLMACSSSATRHATLAGLPLAFTSAGAGGVIGTEAPVFTGLAARFAHEVTLDLWSGKSIGEAVMQFRRRLLGSMNPLPFAFTAFGDADLRVVH